MSFLGYFVQSTLVCGRAGVTYVGDSSHGSISKDFVLNIDKTRKVGSLAIFFSSIKSLGSTLNSLMGSSTGAGGSQKKVFADSVVSMLLTNHGP